MLFIFIINYKNNNLGSFIKYQLKKTHKMGNGIFATSNISEGEIIESCPYIKLKAKKIQSIRY